MVVLIMLSMVTIAAADASITARYSTAVQTVGTGSWGAVATAATSAPYGTGTLSLTFGVSVVTPPPAQFFSIGNAGSLSLIGATYTVSSSANAVIEACSTAWSETDNTCSGTISQVVATTASPSTSAVVPTAAGSHIRLRARITIVLVGLGATVTVGVSVDRNQVRPASASAS